MYLMILRMINDLGRDFGALTALPLCFYLLLSQYTTFPLLQNFESGTTTKDQMKFHQKFF